MLTFNGTTLTADRLAPEFSLILDDDRIKRMRYGRFRRYLVLLLAMCMVSVGGAGVALATTSSSPNYQIVESDFNSGTDVNSCSGGYCARSTVGSLVAGSSEGTTSRAEFGPVVPDQPSLDVIVEAGGDSELGVLTTGQTAKATMSVKVRNYLSDGYIMQIIGAPPKYSDHTLSTPLTPTASTPGTEQFAINAVANTSPSVGAAPVQVPSGNFSFGIVESAYGTANLFKYTSGETVARSLSESGETHYTISMIINISNVTPAGHYSGDFTAVVVPLY